MRRLGRLALAALACCCPLAALAPEAQAQEVLYTDTAEVPDPFQVCRNKAKQNEVTKEYENPEYVWWERCLDEVSSGGADGWAPFTAEQIYDYMIAAEAALWEPRSPSCTASQAQIDSVKNSTQGMLANALATLADRNLAMDPTYMAWARWKNSFHGTAGQYAGGFFEYDSQWVDIGHWPPPRTHTIAIGKHLDDADEWKYIVHEATHWGGWDDDSRREALIDRHMPGNSCDAARGHGPAASRRRRRRAGLSGDPRWRGQHRRRGQRGSRRPRSRPRTAVEGRRGSKSAEMTDSGRFRPDPTSTERRRGHKATSTDARAASPSAIGHSSGSPLQLSPERCCNPSGAPARALSDPQPSLQQGAVAPPCGGAVAPLGPGQDS